MRKIAIYAMMIVLGIYEVGQCSNKAMGKTIQSIPYVSEVKNVSKKISKEASYKEYLKDSSQWVQSADKWKKSKGKYLYPVSAMDKKWYKCNSIEERFAACQLPRKILKDLSTEEMFEMILDFPLLSTIEGYETASEALAYLADTFNGFDEFMKRDDCYAVVEKYYNEYTIPKERNLDYDEICSQVSSYDEFCEVVEAEDKHELLLEDEKNDETIRLCEAILEQAYTSQNISTEEKQKIDKISKEKHNEKKTVEYLQESESDDAIISEDNEVFAEVKSIVQNKTSVKKGGVHSGYITTPGNQVVYYRQVSKLVEYDYYNTHLYIDKYRGMYFDESGHDLVTLEENGNNGFNCFSYAWLYKRSEYASIWRNSIIDDPEGFHNDSTFYNGSTPYEHGQIIDYGGHAGIVTDCSRNVYNKRQELVKGKAVPMVKSKWTTGGPVVEAPAFVFGGDSYKIYCG